METYCGPSAFSEVEMQNIRDFVTGLEPAPVLSTCFHSYSQLWLWPYGYAYNAYPENYREIKNWLKMQLMLCIKFMELISILSTLQNFILPLGLQMIGTVEV